jgi:hypothetical protein
MELKKNSCEEKLQITQVSYSFPLSVSNCSVPHQRRRGLLQHLG